MKTGRKPLGDIQLICPNCQTNFTRKVSYAKDHIKRNRKMYCSNWCARHSANYRGGVITPQGYHSSNNHLLHRVIMEKHIGRKLLHSEHIHHVNHIKTDNRIENLQVMDMHEHGRIEGLRGVEARRRNANRTIRTSNNEPD